MKDLLWLVYLYPFRWVAPWLPQNFLAVLGRLAAPFARFRSRKRMDVAARRMIAAGFEAGLAPAIARRLVDNAVFRVLADLMPDRSIRCTQLRGIAHLEKARAAGNGVLLLSVHTFASRAAKRYLAGAGHTMLTVRHGRPPDALAGRFGRRFLQPRYMEFLHSVIRDEVFVQDPECALKIVGRLRSGGLVNIHIDAPSAVNTVDWPFLGVPRAFATGPFDIVRLSGCAVVPMSCLGNISDLRISFGPSAAIRFAASREEFVRLNLPPLARIFETQIMDRPEEWELWTRL